MTEPTPDTAADEQQPTDPQEPDTTTEDTDAEQSGGNREAAKYRRQLRDTEAERDALLERVVGYERTEVERLAGEKLADPGDLWAAGVELDALRAEDGAVDPRKVDKALRGVLEQHPHWARKSRKTPTGGGLKSGASSSADTMLGGWSDAFARALAK